MRYAIAMIALAVCSGCLTQNIDPYVTHDNGGHGMQAGLMFCVGEDPAPPVEPKPDMMEDSGLIAGTVNHVWRNKGWYTTALAAVAGDYLEDGDLDGYGLFESSSGSKRGPGENIVVDGNGNRIHLRESLSPQFTLTVRGTDNSFEQGDEPLEQPQGRFSPGANN